MLMFCVLRRLIERDVRLCIPLCWLFPRGIARLSSLLPVLGVLCYLSSGFFPCFLLYYYSSDYPCDMVAVLNVTLFMTADSSHRVRERAAQLLQVLER